jgi:ABC-type Zn uptake system ZnuABC Zn-binding protein ZnuA
VNRPRLHARSISLLAGAALAAIALASCGVETETRGSTDPGAPTIVATSGIAADIVANVGGDDVRVLQLVPDGSSPHSYSPSAKQQAEIEDSDLLVLFSPALEEALPLEIAPRRFAIAEHTGTGDGDPHVWMDPTLIEAALPDLADALAEVDPEHARAFRERARRYGAELARLDSDLARMAASVPPADRKLVTSHDLMGHFADRYGYEFIGAPFGISPEAEPSATSIDELIADVEAAGVPAVFAQTGDDPEVLERVADEAGVEVVDDLLVESLGDRAGTYEEMMRYSAGRIADALSPQQSAGGSGS